MHLGIDFGTTRSVVALADRGNYPVVTFVGHDGASYDHYPSVCAAKAGELRFGFDALAVESEPAWQTYRSFKRFLNEPEGGFQRTCELGETRLPTVELIAQFLEQLKRDLVSRSTLPEGISVEQLPTALAVPANAHSAARLITLEAFRRAGFNVVAMLNEPSAAAIEYAHRYRSTITSRRENVLVYDLGGGTFDSTLVLMCDKKHDVLKSRGITRLGGDDFDRALLDLALRQFNLEAAELPGALSSRLQNYCREQKERLRPNTRRLFLDFGEQMTESELAMLDIDRERTCIVPTESYRQVCAPLIARTLDVLERLQQEWYEETGHEPLSDVAGLYVVGGASALPFISRRLREVYGRRIHRSNYPSTAIAIGLAIALDGAAGYQVKERFSRQFGVFREGMLGQRVEFDVIFDASTELPQGTSFCEVRRRYAPTHNLGHYRYVECGWLDQTGAPSGDITSFADVLFPFDRELRGGRDLTGEGVRRADRPFCEVEEHYRVDRNGIVELTIVDLHDGFRRSHRFASPEPG